MISTLLAGVYTRLSGYLFVLGSSLIALSAIYAAGKRNGRQESENTARERDLNYVVIRSETERNVAQHDDPADELWNKWARK